MVKAGKAYTEVKCELIFERPLITFNGETDHVHLLFQYHPKIQLSKLVNSLKSVSSRKIRQEFLRELEKIYYQKKVDMGLLLIKLTDVIKVTELINIQMQ